MAKELAFVLINPYTIAKSRTGGVFARVISRTDVKLVGARMYGPSKELAEEYAALVRHADPEHPETCALIADYIRKEYAPDPVTGRPRRVMLLIFEGEGAVRKIWDVTGGATNRVVSGSTIRDTYGDYLVNEDGSVRYFEPAVLVSPTVARAGATLRLWARYSKSDGGIVAQPCDLPDGANVQKTVVMLKPDNFKFPSLRPGSIVDVLSSSGLRIVAVRKFSMTVAQAEEFYAPVRQALAGKFAEIGAVRAANVLTRELGFTVPVDVAHRFCAELGPLFADSQFESIVEFMTGYRPADCKPEEKATAGREECLALLYEGVDAVAKIRRILGPTDPSKAAPGSVRREFGKDIMVNAAHASDSPENAEREMRIIRIAEDNISPWVERYFGLGEKN